MPTGIGGDSDVGGGWSAAAAEQRRAARSEGRGQLTRTEHGPTHDITNSIDARDIGRKVLVNLDLPAAVDLDTDIGEAQTLGHRRAARRDEHNVYEERERCGGWRG